MMIHEHTFEPRAAARSPAHRALRPAVREVGASLAFRGRVLSSEPLLDPAKVTSVGFLISDKQVVFDRLLCRLFRHVESPWLLKGGYTMELRIQSLAPRATLTWDFVNSRVAPRHGMPSPFATSWPTRRVWTSKTVSRS